MYLLTRYIFVRPSAGTYIGTYFGEAVNFFTIIMQLLTALSDILKQWQYCFNKYFLKE